MASLAETILAPVREAAGRAGLTDFLGWWRSELAALVPAGWRERFDSSGVAYLGADADAWRALRPVSGSLVEAGRAGLGGLDTAGRRAALRRLVEPVAGGATNVWLVVPADAVLRREVTMPLAAEEALRDAVGFELDRLTPLTADHACYDFRVKGRDSAGQRLTLELAVSARAAIASRLDELREMGATVLGVGVEGDLGLVPTPFNLLAPEDRDRPAVSRSMLLARALAVLAALLALVALAYPLLQKREAVIALQPRLDKAKAGAEVADRLAKEIAKMASEHNFLVAKKQGQYPAVTLLEDLSRLLPDTTWIQQLDVKAGPKARELQIAGETGSSSQLVEVLEKSGSLANASFKSPLTKGVTPGTERFLVSAEVKPRPLPEPIPESALAAAPVPAPGPGSAAATSPAAPSPSAATPTSAVPAPAASSEPAKHVGAPAKSPPPPGAAPAPAPGPASPPVVSLPPAAVAEPAKPVAVPGKAPPPAPASTSAPAQQPAPPAAVPVPARPASKP